jgi:aconitate hydratase
MGCIGMGQAPSTGTISLRTMPRNFPGRSGTTDDQVYLCSPETASVSALYGKITDPKEHGKKNDYPTYEEPGHSFVNTRMLMKPSEGTGEKELKKGPNILSLPDFSPLEDRFSAPVLLKMKDNISTDEILKAGAEVLPLRSNIKSISRFCYAPISDEYYKSTFRARDSHGGHLVIAGENYAQGSSREHAAMAPRYLGQKAVIAKSYARIGFQNLVNYGIVPFVFDNPEDYGQIEEQDILEFSDLFQSIKKGETSMVRNSSRNKEIKVRCELTSHQKDILLAGGLINLLRDTLPG